MTHEFVTLTNRAKNHTGDRYGLLTVLGPIGRDARSRPIWLASCECGSEVRDYAWNLSRNTSCGCHRAERMGGLRLNHGHSRKHARTPTYYSWCSMITRCENTDHDSFPYYGGRGIKVCDRWRKDFAAFLADMGERPAGMTIDRKDPDGDYAPGNCRWATASQQAENSRFARATSHAAGTTWRPPALDRVLTLDRSWA